MAESFYGGKAGFGFILRPNVLREDGKWTSLGNSESPDQDSIYGGVVRGDIRAGEYAIVDLINQSDFYRISNQLEPILISSIEKIKGPDGDGGGTSQWHTGIIITGSGVQTINIQNSHIADMYLNTDTGEVYCQTSENQWTYQDNIKGPPGENGSFAIYNGESINPLSVQKIEWIPFDNNNNIITTSAQIKETIRVLGGTQDSSKALEDYHFLEANIPISQRKKIKWKIDISNSETQWITDQINDKFTIGDNSNNKILTKSVWYDASHTMDDKNSLHIYRGGSLLPPAISVSNTISVFIGNKANIGASTKLCPGLYIILPNGLVRIGAWRDWVGLTYNINNGQALSNCSIVVRAVYPFYQKESIPSQSETIYSISWAGATVYGPTDYTWTYITSSEFGTGFGTYCLNNLGEPVIKTTIGNSNQIFNNCWEFIQAITQNGESVLNLQVS